MSQIKRRQYLIDPPFQLTFISRFCLVVIVSSLLIGGAVFYLTQGSTTVAIENTRVYAKPTAEFILPSLSLTVIIVAAVAALVVLVLALLITHKIAGPVFRLKKEIALMKDGDMTRKFALREKDYLQGISKALIGMEETFRAKHADIRAACGRVRQFLEEKDYQVSAEDREELNRRLKDIDGALEYFKAQ